MTNQSKPSPVNSSNFVAEALERRMLLAAVEWIGGVAGNWNDPANWSGGSVPGIDDDVRIIATTFPTEVALDSGDHAINSLTVQGSTLNMSGGTMAISDGGEFILADLILSDGILTTSTTSSAELALYLSGLEMSGGVLKGNLAISNGAAMHWTGGEMALPGMTRGTGVPSHSNQIGGPKTPILSRPLIWHGRDLSISGNILFNDATLEYDTLGYRLLLDSASILDGGGTNALRFIGGNHASMTGDNAIQVPVELGYAVLGGFTGASGILRLLGGGSAGTLVGSGELNVGGPGFQIERFGEVSPFDGDVHFDSGVSTIGSGEVAGGVIVQGADTQLMFTGDINIGFLSGSGEVVFDGGVATVTGYTIIPRLQVRDGAVASFGGAAGSGGYLAVNELAQVIGAGSLMQLNNIDANIGALNIGAGAQMRMIGNGSNVLRTSSFTVEGSGFLDLRRESLILDYDATSPLSSVRTYLTSGYNGGAWNGSGIQSSFASGAGRAIGYAEASAIFSSFPATFAGPGHEIDDTTVLLTSTLYGDANLDRRVNLRDFNRLAVGFGSGSLWSQGNFNYDAIVSLLDFELLAGQFGQSADPQEDELLV